MREDVFKPSVEVGVKRIGADWRVGGFVAPLFVAPEPKLGVLSNDGLHGVPAGLGDLLMC